MKALSFLFSALLLSYSFQTRSFSKARSVFKEKIQSIILEKGENTSISSPSFEKTWLSSGKIISVIPRGDALFIQARQKGEALLNVGSQLYKIQVLSKKEKNNLFLLKNLLSRRWDLRVTFAKTQMQITGQLYRLKDFKDIVEIAQKHQMNYLFQAGIDPSLRPAFLHYLESKVGKLRPTLSFSWQTPLVAMIGGKHPFTEFYRNTLKKYGITLQLDSSILAKLPLVELSLLLVESNSNRALLTHLPWKESSIHSILDRNLFQKIIDEFQVLESKGQAHILSQAVLLNESGKSSQFLSGGEVPIPIYHSETKTQSVKWKPYGIRLHFDTKTGRKKNIHVKVKTEISEVDHSFSANSSPSLKTSHIHSSVTLKNGQTLALSTWIRKQEGKSFSAPWPLLNIPAIGQMLSLNGKIKGKTRLHIFIRARIKENE